MTGDIDKPRPAPDTDTAVAVPGGTPLDRPSAEASNRMRTTHEHTRPVVRALIGAVLLGAAVVGQTVGASAVDPSERLGDAAMEQRARALSAELRCLVCQNQSIDDSNAPLAKDLRVLVRQQLVAGKTDQQVLDHVVARYGEFVLLRPRWSPATALLWLAPLLLLGAAFAMLYGRARPNTTADTPPLTAAEQERLDRLMGRSGSSNDAGSRDERARGT